ncbi:MAG: DNA polymerase III subunit gamma/tau [Acidobacteriota bacterium]
MSYQVIARKYRPQTFEEVVGQKAATTTLRNAIQSGRIGHAFLFSGVRGVGKTTMARILAKALNCRESITATPCGKCVACTEIAQSNSLDVQEIDAASNTGVDNIRELRESVQYGTARDRFKIFIIDEVHMLSNAAFNALLKTLEEPPAHVKFILATTEKHKIPVTITSRCQHFDFRPIQFQEIYQRLQEICRGEGIAISDEALRAIAEEGQGSMRDAQSALDQILSLGGKEVDDQQVRLLLGLADERLISGVLEAALGRDRRNLLELMQQLSESGAEPQHFCRELIRYVRNLLVCGVTGWDERLLHLPDTQKDKVMQQSERFSRLELLRFYDLLNRTQNELKWHSHPAVHLEISLMMLVELAELASIEEVIGELRGDAPPKPAEPRPSRRSAPAPSQPRPRRPSPSPDPSPPPPKPESRPEAKAAPAQPRPESTPPWEELPPESDEGENLPVAPQPATPVSGSLFDAPPASADEPPAKAPSEAEGGTGQAEGIESRFLTAVQKEAAPLYPFLCDAREIRYGDGVLTITYAPEVAFHKALMEKRENQEVLQRLCANITGSQPRIRLLVDDQNSSEPTRKRAKPEDDPKVKGFMEKFPGKLMVVEHTPEE